MTFILLKRSSVQHVCMMWPYTVCAVSVLRLLLLSPKIEQRTLGSTSDYARAQAAGFEYWFYDVPYCRRFSIKFCRSNAQSCANSAIEAKFWCVGRKLDVTLEWTNPVTSIKWYVIMSLLCFFYEWDAKWRFSDSRTVLQFLTILIKTTILNGEFEGSPVG